MPFPAKNLYPSGSLYPGPSGRSFPITEDRTYVVVLRRANQEAAHTIFGSSDGVVYVQAAAGSGDVAATFGGGVVVTWPNALPGLDWAFIVVALSGTTVTLYVDGEDLGTKTVVRDKVRGTLVLGVYGAGDAPLGGQLPFFFAFRGSLEPSAINYLAGEPIRASR